MQNIKSWESEYASIRAEIIETVNNKQMYIIAMYTITITILGIVFESKSIDATVTV